MKEDLDLLGVDLLVEIKEMQLQQTFTGPGDGWAHPDVHHPLAPNPTMHGFNGVDAVGGELLVKGLEVGSWESNGVADLVAFDNRAENRVRASQQFGSPC